jgi:hypothetical protein
MTPQEMTDKDLQTVRLLLMMYRQGWLDAGRYLAGEANRHGMILLKQYRALCDD